MADEHCLGEWAFVPEQSFKTADLEFRQIPPREQRRVKRSTRQRHPTIDTNDKIAEEDAKFLLECEGKLTQSSGTIESSFEFNESESDNDDTKYKAFNSVEDISEKVYRAACRQLKVKPENGIIRSLASDRLSIKEKSFTSKEVGPLAYALTRNNTVTKLDVSGNDIGKDGLLNIIRMLDENICISCLNVSHNNLGSAGAKLLKELLIHNQAIQTLLAAGNKFRDADALEFAESLKKTTSLQILNLSHNNFREEAGKFLSNGIENNRSLTEIDLSWNNLRFGGAKAIAEALKKNSNLRKLNFAWNGLANEGCRFIAESLHTNTSLQQLDLSNNRIGYDGCHALAHALQENQCLQHLILNLNSLTTLGALELLTAIRDNEHSSVRKLELQEFPVLESALEVEKEIMSTRPDFKVIHDVTVRSADRLVIAECLKKIGTKR